MSHSSLGVTFGRFWNSARKCHCESLLFLAFINDLPASVRYSSRRLFASDCVLNKQTTSTRDNVYLQEDVNILQNWEQSLMQFHPLTCQGVRVTNKQKLISASYIIHERDLGESQICQVSRTQCRQQAQL